MVVDTFLELLLEFLHITKFNLLYQIIGIVILKTLESILNLMILICSTWWLINAWFCL
jgi:hypothetical protein